MKKLLLSLLTILLLLSVIAAAGLIWVLQSPYANKLINLTLEQYTGSLVSVREACVTRPNHLSLRGVQIHLPQSEPLEIDSADIWVNPVSLIKKQPVIDSLLLNGLNLQSGLPEPLEEIITSLRKQVRLHQIAIAGFDYADNELIIRDGSIQIREPRFAHDNQLLPFGTIQFSAEQLYWQGEALNNLLLDGDYLAQKSTLYGLSFQWRGGEISGQAEQSDTGWSLVNMTIRSLHLDRETTGWLTTRLYQPGSFLSGITHINSLDILNSSFALNNITLTNLALSAEQLNWPFRPDSQTEGSLSLNAESIDFMQQQFQEPALQLHFTPEHWLLDDFSTEFREGQIQCRGELSKGSVHLSEVNIDRVKWFAEIEADTAFLRPVLEKMNTLLIDQLNIRYSQFIQLSQQPDWQISGLHAEGKQLELIRNRQPGMWNGELTLRAANASINSILTEQPLLSMQSKDGQWQLNRSVMPLENGLLKAQGQYNFTQPSQPWELEITSDGLPLHFFSLWLSLPADMQATTEFQLKASGLAGDKLMLQHSLTGELTASLRDTILTTRKSASTLTIQPVEVSDINITANRGRLDIQPVTLTDTVNGKNHQLTGELTGHLDLLHPESGSIQLGLDERCQKSVFDLLNKTEQHTRLCD
ncbi:AsmA family protein [Vibrio sp. HA2012]|uniref:AsmA family protein n=1 Tax=Vibrio sp. HA2012 TaxID=1971595 RepID=UPI000C2CA9E8|nr:AsmA family protein [Vibrio sp. HA2012]PJC85073.1 AsmA family protein [Vibrio sp. HA2012]